MKFSPIRVSTIRPDAEITFDLHLHFKDNYLLYLSKGSAIEKDKLKKLRKQKLGKFFIDSGEEGIYQQYLDVILNAAVNDANMAADEKAEVITGACQDAVEGMMNDPNSKEAYNATTKASNTICSVLKNDPTVLKEMFNIKHEDDDVILNSASNCSALAVRMAQEKGFKDEVIGMIGTACLLRDIGISKIDDEYRVLFSTPTEDFSKEQEQVWRSHPGLGKDALSDRDDVPKGVLDIVYSHEAKLQGNGFPKDVGKLTPEQALVSLASAYDRRVTCLGQDTKSAIKDISIEELGNYDLDDLKFLKQLLKKDGLLG